MYQIRPLSESYFSEAESLLSCVHSVIVLSVISFFSYVVSVLPDTLFVEKYVRFSSLGTALTAPSPSFVISQRKVLSFLPPRLMVVVYFALSAVHELSVPISVTSALSFA